MRSKVTMQAGYVRIDTDTMKAVLEDIRVNGRARVHVGILGSSERAPAQMNPTEGFWDAVEDKREPKEPAATMSNASLGAVHEFGVVDQNIPSRSFLRMPVIQQMPAALKATDKRLWHNIILKNGIVGALSLLGVYALDTIQLAFDTGGFGFWQPLKPRTIKRKGSSAILIDTAQMRQAITAEVVLPK